MRLLPRRCLFLAMALAPPAASATDIAASTVNDVSVTVYRAPYGQPEALNLDSLDGFALVSETRTVAIPAGESRIRFEGVADGIDAASAIITGLPDGVLEKNRDARLLSPSALVSATVGRAVMLARTSPATGNTTAITGTLRSDADGVTFKSAAGLEAQVLAAVRAGDVLMVKGSNGSKTKTIVAALERRFPGKAAFDEAAV